MRDGAKSCADWLNRFLPASVNVEILGKIGVHFGFGEADDFRREFDEWQAALPHQVVNRPSADV